jgi:SulP family sulfate permease
MRTVVNINAGGTGKLAGMIHSVVLLVVLLGAGEYAKLIPLPVLAGILITVGIGIIDYKGIKHLAQVPRSDAVVMIIVLTLTVFVDLLQAVAVGLVLASLLFMKHMGDVAESNAISSSLGDFHDNHLSPDEKGISEAIKNQIHVHHFDGPIFFGFTSHFKEMMKVHPEVSVVIFRMQNVPSLDQSAMYAIEDAVLELQKKGISVVMTGIQQQPKDMLENIKLIPDLVPQECNFENFKDAIKEQKTINWTLVLALLSNKKIKFYGVTRKES